MHVAESYHVIVLESSSRLKKSSNGISKIFSCSVRMFASPVFEPAGPILCPHLWAARVAWFVLVTIKSIACLDHRLRSMGLLAHNPWNTDV